MNLQFAIWSAASVVGFALFFGCLFAFVGAIAGFLIGLGVSMYYEEVLGIGNPQGPLLFLITGPLGFLGGLVFGAWRGAALSWRFRPSAEGND